MSSQHIHVLSVTGHPERISGFKELYRQVIREIINQPITHHAAENDLIEFVSIDPLTNATQIDAPHWDSAKSSKLMYPFIDPVILNEIFDTFEINTISPDFIQLTFITNFWDFVGVLPPLSTRFPYLHFKHIYHSGFGNFCEIFWVVNGKVYDYKFESYSNIYPRPYEEEDWLMDDLPHPEEIAIDLSCFEMLKKHRK